MVIDLQCDKQLNNVHNCQYKKWNTYFFLWKESYKNEVINFIFIIASNKAIHFKFVMLCYNLYKSMYQIKK